MTPRQRALILAKRRIEADKFICYALADVAQEFPDLEEVCTALCEQIEADLKGFTLLTWVSLCGYRTYDLSQHTRDLCRMAWIDKMMETP